MVSAGDRGHALLNGCATNEVIPCTVTGQHSPECTDNDCTGCLPTPATVGALCSWCFEEIDREHSAYQDWRGLMIAAGWRAVSSQGGGTPLGYTLIPPALIDADAADRLWRAAAGRSLEEWVREPAGALEARAASRAARRARLAHPIEERKPRVHRARCEECGLLTVSMNRAEEIGAHVVVTCEHCGARIAKVYQPGPRWDGSPECEHDQHADCDNLDCACSCHDIGSPNRPRGIFALIDGDQHSLRLADRSAWEILPGGLIREKEPA